jgi:hypothetical protein
MLTLIANENSKSESREEKDVAKARSIAPIHDFNEKKRAQLRSQALKRVQSAAKNLSW